MRLILSVQGKRRLINTQQHQHQHQHQQRGLSDDCLSMSIQYHQDSCVQFALNVFSDSRVKRKTHKRKYFQFPFVSIIISSSSSSYVVARTYNIENEEGCGISLFTADTVALTLLSSQISQKENVSKIYKNFTDYDFASVFQFLSIVVCDC